MTTNDKSPSPQSGERGRGEGRASTNAARNYGYVVQRLIAKIDRFMLHGYVN